MSYDLFLSSPRLTEEAFKRYFDGRASYEEGGWYINESTGVYFSFDFEEADAEEVESDPDMPDVLKQPHVAFNLNYFRPHVFALEADQELAALVKAFDCTVFDPQSGGPENGQYVSEEFLRAWNQSNAWAFNSITREGVPDDLLLVSDDWIERVWRWNMALNEQAREDEEGYFLPLVNWAKTIDGGSPVTFSVWGKGVAIAIPECATHVLLVRDKPVGFFGRLKGEAPELQDKLIPVEEIAELSACEWIDGPHGRVLRAPSVSGLKSQVERLFDSGFADTDKLILPVPSDQVLGSSLRQ